MSDFIKGKNVNLRLCTLDDASFINALRQNKHLTQFLPQVENDVAKQKAWLEGYKKREATGTELYFIVEDKSGQKIGTVRLQEIDRDKKTFTLGSFIIDREKTGKFSSLETITILFDHAFNTLGLNECNFFCRNENYMATGFYEKYQAPIIKRDEENTYYLYPRELFNQRLPDYLKTIKNGHR